MPATSSLGHDRGSTGNRAGPGVGPVRRTKILVAVVALAAAGTVPLSTATASPSSGAQTPALAEGVAAARARTMSAEQQRAAAMARALGLDARESLRVRDVIRDADGSTHVRYDRAFSGLRVIGGDLVVHRSPS